MSKTVSKVTASAINEAHRLAKECAETAVQHAIRCGQLLTQKKAELDHGEFKSWVTSRCEVPYSTAALYMKASRQIESGKPVDALRALYPSGQKTPNSPGETPSKNLTVRLLDPPPAIEKPAEKVEVVATFPAVPPAEPEPEDDWSPDELAKAEAIEREYDAAMAKVMDSDDKLAAAHAEIKRQAAEIAILKLARDGYMNGKTEMTRLLDAALRKVDRLEKKLKAADNELEALRERVAIMESAA